MSRLNIPRFKPALYALGFPLMLATLPHSVLASCEYVVTDQWNNGFVANIRITNDGKSVVNNWSLTWKYSGQDKVAHAWSTNLSGSNPYTATSMSWNATLQPKQTIIIGFQGNKGNGQAEVPVVTGSVCAAVTQSSSSRASTAASSKSNSSTVQSSAAKSSSSVPRTSSSVSSAKSSVISVSSNSKSSSSSLSSSSSQRSSAVSSFKSSSSATTTTNWNLNAANSYLNFVTTKNTHTVEVHNFNVMSGDIFNGVAKLTLDLNSVNTGIALRDQRIRDLLFQTSTYTSATITVNLPTTLLSNFAVGASQDTDISAELDLHGIKAPITTRVSVQRLSSSTLVVQSIDPVIIKAPDYSLAEGVEALRNAVGIASISTSVPVDFTLVFDAR